MKLHLLVFFSLMMALTGCATATVAKYPNANYQPTNPAQVQVYSNFPPVEFELIGEVEGDGAPAATWGSVSGKMKEKAAEIGGDAVVILVKDTPFSGTITTPGTINGSTTGTSNSTRYFGGDVTGNQFSGNSYGSSSFQSNSEYTYTPPTSTPLYRKYQRGFVIKFKNGSQ